MSGTCSLAFERLAGGLGEFGCGDAHAVANLSDPTGLSNWTLPVLELVIIGGGVLALIHAIKRAREGHQAGLAIWLGTIAYLLILEPPLYFPQLFGLEDRVGLIFVHNRFTVQFSYLRLPLYVVMLYTSIPYLAFEIVRRVGVFERRGLLLSATCIGLVHGSFYEVFDQLGPQLRWWIWNPDAPSNTPSLAAVPLSRVVLFGVFGPAALGFAALALVERPNRRAGALPAWSLLWRTVVVGCAAIAGMLVASVPANLTGFGADGNITYQTVIYTLVLVSLAVAGTWIMVDARRATPMGSIGDRKDWYVRAHSALFLSGFVVLWAGALPAYFDASGGITADGTPIGSLPFVVASFALATFFTWMAVAPLPSPADARGDVAVPAGA